MTDGSFLALFQGRVTHLNMSVDLSATAVLASRPSGVYRLNSEDFRTICEAIAVERNALKKEMPALGWPDNLTGENIAQFLDAAGTGNRWFRLSIAVAEWLERSVPITEVHAHIG